MNATARPTLLTPISNSPEDGFGLGHGQSSQSPAVHVHDLVSDEEAPVSAKVSCIVICTKVIGEDEEGCTEEYHPVLFLLAALIN